jgi:hypothetical protein
MMRNDNIDLWNAAEQFPPGGIASELAVVFPAWRCRASLHTMTTVSRDLFTLTGTSKEND